MHTLLKTAALAAFILAPAACGNGGENTTGSGGTSSSSGSGGSGPTVAQACADSVHASCEKRDSCSMNGFENGEIYGSEATCEARGLLTCASGLMAKGTAQTPTHLEQCVALYPGYACPDFYDNNPSGACVPPVGSLAMGAACGANGQCTSTFCASGPYAVCGTCAALPAVGAMCLDAGECARNLACVKAEYATPQTEGVCTAYAASGASCLTYKTPCEEGLSCVGDVVATQTTGTCQPAATTLNAACDRSRKTMADCNFQLGLECIPAAKGSPIGTCQAVQLVPNGQPCGDIGAAPITGFAECEGGGLCQKASPMDTTGTCVSPAADNAACDSDPSMGPPCLSPAKCIPAAGSPAGTTAGTCTVPDATKCM